MKKVVKTLIIIFISIFCSIQNIDAKELPKVYFEGNIKNMNSKEDERKIKLTYTSDNLNFEAYTLIKVQGTSSLAYDKKNYTINLYEDENYTNKKKINVGFGDESKYCLKANWIDKTHARNIVTARIASDIQNKYNLFMTSPNNGLIDGIPVEIYINNKFLGIYTWNIPKDEWMFNMDKDNPNHIVLAGDINSPSTTFKELATFSDWEVEVGPETQETLDKFNEVVDFIINSTDEEFKNNFEKHLNLDATLNYYVMLEFAELLDNTSKNMLMATYDGTIWYPTLYDLDTSWGTTWNGKNLYDYNQLISEHTKDNLLWTKFRKNFPNEIANRYFELRKDILTKENILDEFNKFTKSIPEETFEKENNRWKKIPGYDLNQIEDFLNTRIPIVDKNMYELYTIEPNITIKYSTKKKTLFPVEVTIIPNRTDIRILKNNKLTYDYTYTFKNNNEYTFEYQDWYNNVKTDTIKVDWIINNNITYLSLSIIIILTTSKLLSTKQKKSTPNKNNSKKSTPIKESNNKKRTTSKNSITKKTTKKTSKKHTSSKKKKKKKS